MTLPEIEKRLQAIVLELQQLVGEIPRRRFERGPRTSRSMTPELRSSIRFFADMNPGWSQAEIAKHFKVNPGRVSEILRGKRK